MKSKEILKFKGNLSFLFFSFCLLSSANTVFAQEAVKTADAEFTAIAENPPVKKALNACAIADRKAKEDCLRATRKLLENARKTDLQGSAELLQADLDFLNSAEFSPYEFSRHDTSAARREAASRFLENRKQCVEALEKVHANFAKRKEDESATAVRNLITEIKKKSSVFTQGTSISLKDSLEMILEATPQGQLDSGDFSDNIFISPNGKILVAGGGDNWATAWNIETGKVETNFPNRKGVFFTGAFSADGSKFYAGCRNGWVCRYDTETWTMEKSMQHNESIIYSLVPHSDGSVYVANGNGNEGIKRFDFQQNQIDTFGGPRSARALDINSEETWILVGYSDGMIGIFDLNTRKMLNLWKHADREVHTVRFYKHATEVISGCFDSTVAIWNTRTGERLVLFSDFSKLPRDMILSKDESFLFVAQNMWYEWDPHAIYPVIMIDLRSKLPVSSFAVRERCSNFFALSVDEKLLYTPARVDVGVQVWNVPDRDSIDATLKKIKPRYSLPIFQ